MGEGDREAVEGASPLRRRGGLGNLFAIAPPYLWLLVFFLFPFALVFKLSLSHTVLAMPPYAPTLDWRAGRRGWARSSASSTLAIMRGWGPTTSIWRPICRA